MTALKERLSNTAARTGAEPDYWTQVAWLNAGASPLMAWRRAARFSVQDLAEISGISAQTITAAEARQQALSPAQMATLATALGLSPGDLED
ncbi:helix-turn-helix protein [Rhodobacter aestuarii]|uniref:Helix-turn-helix domain-containing protein n=1 Tax=Rhodobacter aestuarii TaxID=453582 RepID=A0A1N7J511_9RHOB|nr:MULTISPECIES: helix-turn-helix transcriptional regulator [Rhodobacter]PTV97173.1 helix-turn-helix protein [Rhodobacter aestuarii]SIS44445.1 Helix-turn-helix domain-containing protein [Rhodobacter aestuarii]SOB98886.1 helix-turn-helix protein [Rhodobacter sp. JA431]